MTAGGGNPNYRKPILTDQVEIRPVSGGPRAVCALADLLALFGGGDLGGIGPYTDIPAVTGHGVALGAPPAGMTGARLSMNDGESISFTILGAAPTAAVANPRVVSKAGTGPNWDEGLLGGMMVYVTAFTGAPQFRWY